MKKILPIIAFLLMIPMSVSAQDSFEPFQLGGITGPQEAVAGGEYHSQFTVDEGKKTGKLQVVVKINEGCHLFSTTQPDDGPGLAAEIRIEAGFEQARLTGKFEPDSDPEIHEYPGVDVPGEEHHGTVTFTAPVEFADGVDPSNLVIPVKYNFQICVDDGACNQFSGLLEAEAVEAQVTFTYEYSPADSHVTVRAWADHTNVQPGDQFNLLVELEPESGWVIDDYAIQPSTVSSPSLVVLTKRNDANMLKPTASADAAEITAGELIRMIHRGPVTWTFPIKMPRSIEEGKKSFQGWVGYRASSETEEGNPTAVQFSFELEVGTATVAAKNDLALFVPDGADYGKVATLAQQEFERTEKNAGAFAGYSIPAVLGLAFIAGLILNIMPCVLPVIGLKVLSFVQQAGEDKRRILLLNLVFAAGILSVFMILATLATFPQALGWGDEQVGWGGLFQSQTFTIIMVSVVFAFGLSFLGVWEIPIPGFVSTSASGKDTEGYGGAFTKGILTTLLATPCSGPLLIPAVTWAIAQPPLITFLTFFALGLGMAFPFILIGFRPSLVAWLPKPGEWMETFKQLMGFVMVAAAVFFFNAINDKYELPVLAFLVFIALACWMAGKISLLQTFPVRMKNWAAATAVLALGGFMAFYMMIPQHELEWQPYSQTALNDVMAEGNVVFIDFTADW